MLFLQSILQNIRQHDVKKHAFKFEYFIKPKPETMGSLKIWNIKTMIFLNHLKKNNSNDSSNLLAEKNIGKNGKNMLNKGSENQFKVRKYLV